MDYNRVEIEQKLDALFAKNPMYKPYVGTNYHGILVIGESHYVDVEYLVKELTAEGHPVAKTFNREFVVKVWGTDRQKEIDEVEKISNWYNTRHVVNEYIEEEANKSFWSRTSYIYFRNLNRVFEKRSLSWRQVAYMNFYQVPCLKSKESIRDCFDIDGYASLIEKANSQEIVKKTIEILDPQLIIITTKSEAYELMRALPNRTIIRCTHPSCAWWNRRHGPEHKRGSEYLEDELTKYFESLNQ